MVASGNSTLDIAILSSFNASGFTSAIRTINQFVGQVNRANSSLNNMGKAQEKAGQTTQQLSNQTQKASTQMFSATSGATKTAEAYRKMASESANLKGNVTYMGQSIRDSGAQIIAANSQLKSYSSSVSSAGETMNTMATQNKSTFQSLVGGIQGGVSAISGYFGGLIAQTISVGDIFGYYIGMMALQAIWDFTMGVATMRDEMETTFEFMGYGTGQVKEFSKELTEFAVRLPSLSIKGANTIARTLAMNGVKLSEIKQYKQTWADIAKIGGTLNDWSPEVAASKVGPMIADTMSGANWKRMTTMLGVTTSQFKKKADEMGIAFEGSFSGTMKIIQAILDQRNLDGISSKITSIGDAWDYLVELLSFKGSEIGEVILPMIKQGLFALAAILNVIPTPILAIVAGFVGLAAAMMVIMPFLGSFVNGFNLMKLAFQPLTTTIKKAEMGWKDYSKMLNLTSKETERLGKLNKKELSSLGIKKITKMIPGSQEVEIKYYGNVDKISDMYKEALTGQKSINNATYMGKKLVSEYDASLIKVSKRSDGLGGKLKGLGNGFKNLGSSVGSASKAFGLFMLTNPIGIILSIVGALLIVITYTKSWSRITDLMGKVLKALGEALEPLVDWLADVGEASWSAIQKWEGWTKIKAWIVDVKTELMGLYGWVNKNIKPSKKDKEEGKSPTTNVPVVGPVTDVVKEFMTGQNAARGWKTELMGIYTIFLSLANPMTFMATSTFIITEAIRNFGTAWKQLQANNPKLMDEFRWSLALLAAAWEDLKIAVVEAWASLSPSLALLSNALETLSYTLGLTEGPANSFKQGANAMKDGGEKYSGLAQFIGVLISILTAGIKVITIVVKFFALLVKAVAPVIGALAVVFSAIIYGINAFGLAIKKFWPVLVMLYGPFASLLGVIITLWHWITGNSPGLIPAIQSLGATIASIIPPAIGGFIKWLGVGIIHVARFVIGIYSLFRGVPRGIYNALAGIKTAIIQQLANAYNGAKNWIGKFYNIGVWIKDKVVSGIKGALGIKSPSKVTASLGAAISEGLFVGMKQWVNSNSSKFIKGVAHDATAAAQILGNLFKNYHWVYYMNSLQSVNTTLKTMTGNCYDAALAYVALANKMGLVAKLVNTTVHGVAHTVVGLPSIGAWIDPSGILGDYLHKGAGPQPSGAPINVYVSNNDIKEEQDMDKLGVAAGKKILNAVRFGL